MLSENYFKLVVVLINPVSTNASGFKKRHKELVSTFGKENINFIKTTSEDREINRNQILKIKHLLGPKTLFCIAAGDGTVNLVIETLLFDKNLTDEMRLTPIFPLWSGNANDMAHMLNGHPRPAVIKNVLSKGKIKSIYPLKLVIGEGRKVTVKTAGYYASFGATAYAARHINTYAHRKNHLTSLYGIRFLIEFYAVSKTFLAVPTFNILENNRTQSIYEYSMINGSRVAKIERMPVRLNAKAFHVAKIARKHPVALLQLLRVLRQKRFGRITSHPRKFSVLDETWLQTDGEVTKIAPGTEVEISLSSEPFYAISRRLK